MTVTTHDGWCCVLALRPPPPIRHLQACRKALQGVSGDPIYVCKSFPRCDWLPPLLLIFTLLFIFLSYVLALKNVPTSIPFVSGFFCKSSQQKFYGFQFSFSRWVKCVMREKNGKHISISLMYFTSLLYPLATGRRKRRRRRKIGIFFIEVE